MSLACLGVSVDADLDQNTPSPPIESPDPVSNPARRPAGVVGRARRDEVRPARYAARGSIRPRDFSLGRGRIHGHARRHRTRELLMRWMEFSALSDAVFRTHQGNRPLHNAQPWDTPSFSTTLGHSPGCTDASRLTDASS